MSLTSGAYLMHHGRKGQKWGEKNGPPYPLNFDDLSPEERAKAKQESIDKGDTVTAQANAKYYSAKEIDDLILKHKKNMELASINGTDVTKGEKFIKKFVKGATMYVDVVDKSSKVYNITAKVTNAFGLTDLPIIGEKTREEMELKKLQNQKEMKKAQNDLNDEIKRAKEFKTGKKEKSELEKLKDEQALLRAKADIERAKADKDKAENDRVNEADRKAKREHNKREAEKHKKDDDK